MAFPTVVSGSPGYDKTATTTQKHRLGTKMVYNDGRVFYYSYAAAAITAGKVTMGSQTSSGHLVDIPVAEAAAAGANQIKLTNQTTAITGSGKYTGDFRTRGDYVDGYVFINDAAGEGQIFQIADHSSAAASATLTIDLYNNDTVQTALTTSSQAGLHKPVGHSVEVWDYDDIDGPPLGVPTHDIASGEYFWNQSAGPAAVLTNGTVVLGKNVMTGSSADGSVDVMADDSSAEFLVGGVLAVGATGEYSLVDLQIKF
jgi:hypothetical protein